VIDIIYDTEAAFKDMTSLWYGSLRGMRPDIRPMSYQRFKILRAVADGAFTVPDIAESAGSGLSTAAEMLEHLKDGGYVIREPINFRTFKWKMTVYGKTNVDKMSSVLDAIRDDLRNIVKSRLDTWL
jgi:predicted transcriptional regulator